MTRVLRHVGELAVVESSHRVAVLMLSQLDHPAVVLSGTAAEIWRAVDGESSDEEIVSQVADAHGMQPEQVGAEVTECLRSLGDLGLLEPADPRK